MICSDCKASVPKVSPDPLLFERKLRYCGSQEFGPAPGCWKFMTEVLTKKFAGLEPLEATQLVSHAYAASHLGVGVDIPVARQSIAVHAIGLYFALEKNCFDSRIINKVIKKYKGAFPLLPPPKSFGKLSIVDIHQAQTPELATEMLYAWARQVWDAWQERHADLKLLLSA